MCFKTFPYFVLSHRFKMNVNRKLLTLVFPFKRDQILLGYKKRGFGMGKWNGFGGKVEVGEEIEEAARRELNEECALKAERIKQIGVLVFEFLDDPVLMEVHVFRTEHFTGQPRESDEMRPKWYRWEDIPFDNMWADDKIWFPSMLSGSKFLGYFKFEGHSKIIHYEVIEKAEDQVLEFKPLK